MQTSEEMAEGVLLRPDQLASQAEERLVRSQEQKKGKSKIVKKEEVDLEAPDNGEAGLDSFAVSVFVVDVELTNTETAAATPPTVMQIFQRASDQ